jgi:hypothetical protein
MESQQVEYDLTVDDMMAFYDDALRRAPEAKRQLRYHMILTTLIAVICCFFVFYVLGVGFPPDSSYLIGTGLVVVVLLAKSWSRVHKAMLRNIRRYYDRNENRRKFGLRTVVVGPDGVTANSVLEATLTTWEAVTEIVVRHEFVFFHSDSLSALVVPRRAFADDFAFETFVEAAQTFMNNARGTYLNDTSTDS